MEPILAALVFPRLNEYLGILLNSCLGVWLVGGFHFLLSISMTRIPARCKVHQILSMLPWWFSANDLYQWNTQTPTRWWMAISQFSISAIFTYIHPFLCVQSRFQLIEFFHVSSFNPHSSSRKSIFSDFNRHFSHFSLKVDFFNIYIYIYIIIIP